MTREGCGASGSHSAADAAGSAPPELAVQHLERWSAASHLLSPSALERLCGKDVPSQGRQAQLFLSHVIVATYHDDPMGFAAYKPGAAGVRVAHELWVDANAPCGPAPVATVLLGRLERDALKSGCSKLFIVVPQATPLRRILQSHGYVVMLEGADLSWFDKTFSRGAERCRTTTRRDTACERC